MALKVMNDLTMDWWQTIGSKYSAYPQPEKQTATQCDTELVKVNYKSGGS
jgi:hypothetical protein